MKLFLITVLWLSWQLNSIAQVQTSTQGLDEQKRFSFKLGAGYFRPVISEDGVAFSNAAYDPDIGMGFSYLASLDYAISNKFSVGIGFNGNYAQSDFIRDAVVNNQTIEGYLNEGGVENYHILLNLTFAPVGTGLKPFAKLGLGYLSQEVELGDVPLALTNNVETEIFTDFKSSGVGILPEIGVRCSKLFISVAYSVSLSKSMGEEVDGFQSSGELSSNGFQLNLTYNLFRF